MTAANRSDRRLTVVAISWAAAVLIGGIVGLIWNLTAPSGNGQQRPEQFFFLLDPIIVGVVGGFLALRRPRHPAGWLALGAMTAHLSGSLSQGALHHAAAGSHAFDSWLPLAAWLDNWTWTLMFGCISALVLSFPTGRLPGPRWRWVFRTSIFAVLVAAALCALAPTNDDFKRPTIVQVVPSSAVLALQIGVFAFILILYLGLVAAAASLIVRRRRGTQIERQQVRWLLWSIGLFIVVNLASSVLAGPLGHLGHWGALATTLLACAGQISIYGIPIGIMIAITRHGLFEIDRVISRTLSYTLIVASLALCYLAVVAGISFLVPSRFGSIPVVLATLAVAALFVPVQRTIGRAVDHRFNRRRYDAQRLVARFAETVRTTDGLQLSGTELLATVHHALQPAHASVWLVAPAARVETTVS